MEEEVGAARTRLLGAPLRIVVLLMLVPVPVSATSVRALPACLPAFSRESVVSSQRASVSVCVSEADALSLSLSLDTHEPPPPTRLRTKKQLNPAAAAVASARRRPLAD